MWLQVEKADELRSCQHGRPIGQQIGEPGSNAMNMATANAEWASGKRCKVQNAVGNPIGGCASQGGG